MSDEDQREQVLKEADEAYEAKVAIVGREPFSSFERSIMLQTLDQSWREHLTALDALRQGIHLRGYAQKQPKQEYKREAFELFGALLDSVRDDVVKVLMNVRVQTQEEIRQAEEQIEAESATPLIRRVIRCRQPAAGGWQVDRSASHRCNCRRDVH